jgi:hypothetical protein
MSFFCICPEGTAIGDVTIDNCPEQFGPVHKIGGQRLRNGSALNKFVVATGPDTLANWTPFLEATDSTRIVMSPILEEPVLEDGGLREYGGGTQTLGGIPIPLGANPSPFTGKFLQKSQLSMSQMADWACENLGVWLFNEAGQIGCLVDDLASPTEFYPIPVRGFYVGDKVFGTFESVDYNGVQWSFLPGWSRKFKIVNPTDFNGLTDLVTTPLP